ncbi:hypothetical protein CEXT_747101 [Caerostris extrusa]|uniref:Uncharacterized protein n=1 Tax=Caerostris extrusa TaxID=172846 RepID=A0AAV4P3J3_CAEEX|nr:hypothetical protein CEXT_747101 [Caerostris extrusa]
MRLTSREIRLTSRKTNGLILEAKYPSELQMDLSHALPENTPGPTGVLMTPPPSYTDGIAFELASVQCYVKGRA